MKNRASNKILSLVLAAAMLFSMLPSMTVYAENSNVPEASGIITAFDALAEDVAAQNVSAGTAQSVLTMPDTLNATVDGAAGTVTGVTWQSEPTYDGDTAGTYIFTAAIPGEYTLADDVEPPVINVTVGEVASTVTIIIAENENNSRSLYLPEGTAITDADLLAGVSATDEKGNPVEVTIQDTDGLNMDNPQMRGTYPNPPYTITYAAEHPVTEEVFTATREVYVTLGIGAIMPLAEVGDFEITGDTGYTYASNVLTISQNGTYAISMKSGVTTTTDTIVVSGGVTANITLDDVSIQSGVCAFEITGNSAVNLTLSGDNTLSSGSGRAGLQVQTNNTLTITAASTGSLTATGGHESAGIGGVKNGSVGNITISGGTVNATGGNMSAGIGGGGICSGGNITVSGGTVNATSGLYGAGIGGGNYGSGGNITISGGTVTAKRSGTNGCDIGYGSNGSNCTIKITGGSIYPTNGSVSPQPTDGSGNNVYLNTLTVGNPAVSDNVGISSMDVDGASSTYGLNDVVTMNSGKVYFWLTDNSAAAASVVLMVNLSMYSKVFARSAVNTNAATLELVSSASIASGNIVITQSNSCYFVSVAGSIVAINNYAIPFTITGSSTTNTVTVQTGSGYTSGSDPAVQITLNNVSIDVSDTSGACAFAITDNSAVNLTLSGANILKSGGGNAGLQVQTDNTLTITAASTGSLTATGGKGSSGAGIGGALYSAGGTITINGGTVNATGGPQGAGIGGGYHSSGGEITINGGTVNAKGGSYGVGIGGAGIGGGDLGSGGTITINGGTVNATGGNSGKDIGPGRSGSDGTIKINGGSVNPTNGSVSPQPTDGSGNNVQLNTLTVGDPAIGATTAITSCNVSGLNYTYGTNDVYTDTNSKVYFWLEQNDGATTAASVSVTANGDTYAAAWARIGTSETKTLMISPYTVTFNSNGGNTVTSQIINFGDTVTEPTNVTKTGYTFDGWYADSTLNTAWDFVSDTVSGTMTLYAKWTDTTAPTGEIEIKNSSFTSFLNTITFGLFFKNTVNVTVTGTDEESGVATIEYIKTDTAMTQEQLKFETWTTGSSFSVPPNETFIVYARITDNAENSIIISSDGVVVYTDSAQDTTSIIFTKTSANDVTADVTLNGNTVAGVKNSSNPLTLGSEYTVSGNQITFKASYLDTLDAGDYTLTISYNPMGLDYAAGGDNEAPAVTTIALTVVKAEVTPVVSVAPGSQARPNSVTLSATGLPAGATETLQFKANGTNIGTPVQVGQTVSFTASGNIDSYTFTVEYSGDDNYKSATSGDTDFTFDKGIQDTLTITDPGVKTYGDSTFTLSTGSTGSGTGNVSYTITGGDDVISISGNTVTIRGAGTATVTAAKAADDDYNETISVPIIITVNKKEVTISGVTASDKTYDGNAMAALTMPTVTTAMGLVSGDTLTVSATGTFDSKNIGTGKTVTISGLTLGGADASNYILAVTGQQTDTTAAITAKPVTVDVTVNNKAYDGLDTAEIASASLSGVVAGDNVTLTNGTPVFSSTAVGNNIAITFASGFSITGSDAGNYTLTQPTGVTASILDGFTPVKDTHYTLSVPDGNNEWYKAADFVITSASGYKISLGNADDSDWSDSLTYSNETTDGSVTFYIRNTTTNEISVSATEGYKIDKTAPEGEIEIKTNSFKSFLNTITFGLFFKNTVDVKVTGTDATSDIATIEYIKVDTEMDLTELENASWLSYDSFSVNANETFIVYAKITDNAGNVTIINSNGVVVYTDSEQDTDSITYTKTSGEDKTAMMTLNGNTVNEIKNGANLLTENTDYTVANDGTITFKATYLDTLSAGSYTLEVSYNPMGLAYNTGDAPATTIIALSITKANQTIGGVSAMTKTYLDPDFKITPTASGNPAFTFESSNTNAATIASDGTVTITGAGVTTITVKTAATGDYEAGETTFALTVNKAENTITNIPFVNKTYGDSAFTVTPQANENPIFSFTSSNTNVVSVDANGNVTINGAGSATITVSSAETVNYKAATATFSVNVAQSGGQVITGIQDYNATYGDVNFTITPAGYEDPTFTFTSNNVNAATVDANTGVVTIVGAGTATITISAGDTANYTATSVVCVVTVNKAEQILSGLQDLVKVNGGDNFTVTPNSNAAAENPNISFQSSNTAVIDFDTNGNFLIKGDGTATITVLTDETVNYKSTVAAFEIRVLANTADLEDVIDAAQNLINGLQIDDIGKGDGQYPQDAVDKLQDAINKAKGVANDTSATQKEVDQAKEDLLKAIEDFQNSLIAVDFTALDKAIADAGVLEKGYYTDATWNALQAALAAGRTVRSTANVTQEEVDAAAKAINDAISALSNEYKFTTEFGTFTGSGDLTGKIDAPYAKFVKLLIDGKEVDSSNYTVTEGSTVITLKEAYLKTLKNGTYTVTAEFTDGSAATKLTVNMSSTSSGGTDNSTGSTTSGNNPSTGDSSMIWLWIALFGASSLGILVITLTRKRKLFGWKQK